MEDVELRLRITRAGYEFPFVKEASVCHPWRPTGGWKELKRHQKSTLIYLSIHPEESSKINPSYYLSMVIRGFIKLTILKGAKCKWHGVRQALLEHLSFLQMALILTRKFGVKNY
jgi:GT2 family glycosyltransferase